MPPTGPTAPMGKRRGGMFAALGAIGALAVVGFIAAVIVLNQQGSNQGR